MADYIFNGWELDFYITAIKGGGEGFVVEISHTVCKEYVTTLPKDSNTIYFPRICKCNCDLTSSEEAIFSFLCLRRVIWEGPLPFKYRYEEIGKGIEKRITKHG